MERDVVLKQLADKNGYDYNLLKCAEECNELADVLLKKVLKRNGPKEPSVQAITEELGDVAIRVAVLAHLLGEDAVEDRIDFKLNKFENYLKEGKYQGQI